MTEQSSSRCSWLFCVGTVVSCFGACVVGASLGTLAFTSSYIAVFPFGSPFWVGSLFVILGCFMVIAYRPSKLQLPASSRTQIWFTLVISLIAIVESMLAIGLCLWYRMTVFPALRSCTRDLTAPPSSSDSDSAPLWSVGGEATCECTGGFVDPPSLRTTVHVFVGVSNCSQLGEVLSWFHWVLLGLYGVCGVLGVLVSFLAARRLHSFGAFGKSGVYTVTPKPTTPTPDSAATQQVFLGSPSHSVGGPPVSATLLPGYALNQRGIGESSMGTLSTLQSHSTGKLTALPPPRLRQISSASSQSTTAI